MKVVLFCGGLGLRLRDHPDGLPKPMTVVGYRPILWHLMKYYAHFGHKDFILCLGYKADVIKDYFLNYSEAISNDFVLTGGGADIKLLSSDIDDWRITFVDTGMAASVGERLRAVGPYLEGEDVFLANYADGLSDLDLHKYVEKARDADKVASFLAVHPAQTFHVVGFEASGTVTSIEPVTQTELWINGGFFVFRKEIFDYLRPGEDLVKEPFARLIADRQLFAYRYEGGFWLAMDTFKDRMQLEDMYANGYAPWQLWDPGQPTAPPGAASRR
jgi:glucose-1-phosphate cytidylyltransferase